ncbi:MAG TPA: glycosyltransferase family A protein [Trueperaceae bacterium]
MDEQFFTVIIPTYRRPALLVRALQSVAAQTFAGSQVIVVDDAGDAETEAIVAGFPGFEYLINDNAKGGSGARNAGIARATGRWVAFLDDDDLWLPNKLEAVRALIAESTSELGLVYSAAEHFDSEEKTPIMNTRPFARGEVLDQVLYRNVIGGMSVAVVRRDLLERIGGFDERFPAMQDAELYVRLAQICAFDFVDQVLVRVRSARHTRITHDVTKKLQASKLFAEKYAGLLEQRPRLRHRTAARTLIFASAARDARTILANLPWTLAGVLVDPGNVPYVVRSLVAIAKQVPTGRARKAGALP